MKALFTILFLFFIPLTNICLAQENFTIDPSAKIEDYNFGPLDLKVVPFGLGQEINVGKILADGSIQFNWPLIDLTSIENTNIFMEPLKSVLLGMSYCEDDQITEETENCKVVNTQFIYLYKNDKQLGVLYPASAKEVIDNEPANSYGKLVKGSSLSWFYSDSECNFKAQCSERLEWEGKYDFNKENIYRVHLKKGWNIVQYSLEEIENYKDENGEGKMEKKVLQESLENIPDHIQWYVKSFVKIN